MSQKNEIEVAKRRIRALAEKTVENGATEAEAFYAMKKVGELLELFNLSMDEVSLRQEICKEAVFDTGSKHLGVCGGIAVYLARFTQTKVWQIRSSTGIKLHFFGLETDVEMSLYICDLVEKVYATEYTKFKETSEYKNYYGHRKVLNASFNAGFIRRLNHKLAELNEARLEQERETAAHHARQMKERMLESSDEAKVAYANLTTGTALISVTKADHVEKEFGKLGMKLRRGKSSAKRVNNSSAYHAGYSSGDKVNFNRPVGNSVKTNGYLK